MEASHFLVCLLGVMAVVDAQVLRTANGSFIMEVCILMFMPMFLCIDRCSVSLLHVDGIFVCWPNSKLTRQIGGASLTLTSQVALISIL